MPTVPHSIFGVQTLERPEHPSPQKSPRHTLRVWRPPFAKGEAHILPSPFAKGEAHILPSPFAKGEIIP